jgi:rod shape-determining protein MreC
MRNSRRRRVVLTVLVVAALTLIALDVGGGHSPLGRVRSLVGDVFGPVERAFAAVFHPIGDFFAGIADATSYHARLSALQQRNAALLSELRTVRADQHELAQLRRMYDLSAAGRYRVLAAQVIGMGDALGTDWTVTIDVGSADGVRVGQTVLNGDGLVGRISSVASGSATVELAIDGSFRTGVALAPSGTLGYTSGQGLGPLVLTLFSSTQHVSPGQGLVTAVAPFAVGVPVGRVVSVTSATGVTRTAVVSPYVDFSSLDIVGVVIGMPRHNPRWSLLPHPPRPAPTATASTRPHRSPSPGSSVSPSPTRTP